MERQHRRRHAIGPPEAIRRAIELDPRFAFAYAGLADAHTTLGYLGYLAPISTFPIARRELGLESTLLKVRGPAPDLESAFKAMAEARVEALLVLEVPVTLSHRNRIGDLAASHRLPSMFSAGTSYAGGVVSYGSNVADTWPRVPPFVDRILKGAKPGDIPVEVTTRRELVVNLETARDLG